MSDPELDLVLDVEDPRWETALLDPRALLREAVALALAGRWTEARPIEIGVKLTDDKAVQALNREWRGRDKPTNVLSFPMGDPDPMPAGETGMAMPWLAGDIVMAYDTVAAEATEAGKPFAHHVAHLAVHATLHLLGYDHEAEPEAIEMEAAEIALLARLGIPDPYAERSGSIDR